MIPFGSRTVTLIHRQVTKDADGRTQTSFRRYVLRGCSWRTKITRSGTDHDQTDKLVVTCRIPEINGVKPSNGDVLVLGEHLVVVNDVRDFEAILDEFRGNAFKVSQVSDNTGDPNPIPHYAARGE